MEHHHQPTTIAILGADTVVGSALCALLEGSGYRTSPLDSYPTGIVDELLEGADLLLLPPDWMRVYAKPSLAPWARAHRKRQTCR